MDKREETAFVRELVRMKDDAWELFCRQYSAPLADFVRLRFGCNLQESEEIVQMAFVRCVKSIRTFDPRRGRLFPWLKAVARNEGHTLLRRNAGQAARMPLSAIPDNVLGQVADAIDRAPLPDDLLASKELRTLVQDCLLELNSRYRKVLLAKYADGLAVSQIAVSWDTTNKAVESLLSRARASFQGVLLGKLAAQQAPGKEMVQ